MSYTPQQLADLYTLAVSAETQEKRDDGYHDETFAMDEAVMAMAEQGYPELIRVLIDQLRAAQRQPEQQTFEEWFNERHPHSHVTMALRKDEAGNYESDFVRKLHDVYMLGANQSPINTGLSWEDYRGVSSRADVHDAVQDLMGDTTEDNACNLVRAIAEALRPRPRFWIDMHGYSCHLLHSESDAIAHCNETGGLYVLPLFAGEPINTKLPMRMCRPAEEPQTVEVSALLRNLQAIPQKYTSDHVSLGEVFAVIEALRAKP